MSVKLNLPSPVKRLDSILYDQKEIKLFIKRDELIHPWIQGNKWRKLKYNIEAFYNSGCQSIVSPGGAFSNHLIALAALCHTKQIPCTGLIRGEEDVNNPSIQFMRQMEMKLKFISRSEFRKFHGFTNSIHPDYPGQFFIPEGGTNKLAIKGVEEIIAELNNQCEVFPDYVVTAMGSGGTFAGLLQNLPVVASLIGFSVVGDYSFENIFQELLGSTLESRKERITILKNKKLGPFGKIPDFLIAFIRGFLDQHGILLDPVYTGKMMYHIDQLIKKDHFSPGSMIMVLHTGGLQGWLGYNYRYPDKEELVYDPDSYLRDYAN